MSEMITGVNLPAAQLQVAMGIPLAAIPDVRRLYGLPPFADGAHSPPPPINFYGAGDGEGASGEPRRVQPAGHVIAARITAENPDSGFAPTSGAMTELNFRSTPDVWGYFSVDRSGRVHEYADSQIGHLFAWGATREDSRQHLVQALRELSIRGDIRTTTEYLVHLMESPDFRANRIDTAWLDARIQRNVTASKPDPVLVACVAAVCRASAAHAARRAGFLAALERGQYPPPSLLSVDDSIELIYAGVKYPFRVTRTGPAGVSLACNDSRLAAEYRALPDGGLLVVLLGLGRSHVAYATDGPGGLRLVLDGATCLFESEADPTTLRAAMSGKLVRYLVEDGAAVAAGAPYAECEVMKMYMPLLVQEAGVLSWGKPEGSTLEPGDVVATVALDDPSKVRRVERFAGRLPAPPPPAAASLPLLLGDAVPPAAAPAAAAASPALLLPVSRFFGRWHVVLRDAVGVLRNVLAG